MGGFAAATTCEGSQRVGIVRASNIAAEAVAEDCIKEITAHELYEDANIDAMRDGGRHTH